MQADTVLVSYQSRLQQTQERAARALRSQQICLAVLAASVCLVVLFGFHPWWRPILSLLPALFAVRSLLTNRTAWLRLLRIESFYRRGLERLEHRWAGQGCTGLEFRTSGHPYESSLDILGEGSLFELLCTARTGMGRRALSGYLLRPVDLKETLIRQEAVRELLPNQNLREGIALLGKYDSQESTWESFSEWLGEAPEPAPGLIRIAALISSLLLALLLLAAFATRMPWQRVAPLIPPMLAVNVSIAWYYARRTARLNQAAQRVGTEVGVLRQGIGLMLRESLTSAKLRALHDRLAGTGAAAALRHLEWLTKGLGDCDKPLLELAGHVVIAKTQLCLAIEAWKQRHGASLSIWMEAWSEFEALAALSGYAYEHPDDGFPEFSDHAIVFEAKGIGHPLIAAATCVRNDATFDETRRFCVVSGSNMSGKSTLMRSIGINIVLANAGASVCAASLRLSKLSVCASLAIVDSVLDGKSKFLSEAEALRRAIELAREGPVLFLIDEILSGTNSRDRRIASEALIRKLLGHGAVGALSTHDLALTEIADLDGLHGVNVHMGSRSKTDPLDFDYLLKPGVTSETNALAIIRMICEGP